MEEHYDIKNYKESQSSKAEDMVIKGFPETITKLNEILQNSPIFTKEYEYSDLHQDLNISHPVAKNGTSNAPLQLKRKIVSNDTLHKAAEAASNLPAIPTNCYITELVDIVKPQVRKLLWDTNLLKMWITVMIPKVEDGNASGIAVQVSTLDEIAKVEIEAMVFLELIPIYFETRADYISKVWKYPYIEDYRKVVIELDYRQYHELMSMIKGIRNRYCYLHDLVTKNLDKIKVPRTCEAVHSLY